MSRCGRLCLSRPVFTGELVSGQISGELLVLGGLVVNGGAKLWCIFVQSRDRVLLIGANAALTLDPIGQSGHTEPIRKINQTSRWARYDCRLVGVSFTLLLIGSIPCSS